MDHKDLEALYIKKINGMLPSVDFRHLDNSCNSPDGGYAKEILKVMHDLFVETYETDFLDMDHEFVQLPAVVRGRATGHIGLGLVTLDLQSSGEHYGTVFLTPLGVIDDGDEKMSAQGKKYLSDNYGPYDYWYTVCLEQDIHVDFDSVPEKVADLINHCCPGQQEMRME